MTLLALGYVGVRSSRLDDWGAFATGLLGMQQIDRGGNVRAFRMDDRRQRLVVTGSEGEGLGFMGWEVADADTLDALAARLDAHGTRVQRGAASLADERHVAHLITFQDPAGPISGFRTGPFGMGHVVPNVVTVEPLLPFYRDTLGFQVSDFGLTPFKLYFFHLNGRHHSFAMVGSGKAGFHHFMVELNSLDDVGQGYDLAQLDDGRLAYTLGRHTNDHMTSFYAHTPSGFFVEYGWGGRTIDPETWVPHETFDGPSFWGHERLHMPPEGRARLREMRLDAARRGVRAPVVDCPWLDSVISRE